MFTPGCTMAGGVRQDGRMARIWLNGELVEADRAMIPALDRGVLWGQGVFETLRAYEGRPCWVEEHHERLLAGAEALQLRAPDLATVQEAFRAVLEGNDLGDAGVRVTVTGGAGPPEPHADATGTPNTIVTAWPLPEYGDLYDEGAALVTLPEGGRPLAAIKSTSYAPSVGGRIAARRAGGDDGLFVGPGEEVLETTGSNLLVCSGRAIATPPLGRVLAGVTRAKVLEIAGEQGFEVVERRVSVDELFDAEEVLCTSSLREVYPVRSVDGRPTRRRDVARRLREAYRRRVRAELGLD